MPLFEYVGRNTQGDRVKGELEAASAMAAAGQLQSNQITPVDIQERQEHQASLARLTQWWEKQPSLIDLIIFSRQMATLSKAGVPIIRALEGLSETTENQRFRKVLRDVSKQLGSGRSLTQSLSQHALFPKLYISIMRVGEESGRLEDAFKQMAIYLTLEKETRAQIKAAMRYPMMVFSAIFVAMVIINLFVIPTFADIFAKSHTELPLATKILLATSNFMMAYWGALLALLVVSVVSLRWYVKTAVGRFQADRLKLKLPIVGPIILLATLARFSRSFAMTLQAGVPITQGISLVAKAVDNHFVGQHLLDVRAGVERGETLTKMVKNSGLFSPLVIQMLAVGEETGQIDELLLEVADYYEMEVQQGLTSLSSSIEPILITFIGLMVLVLALGVFLPLWNMAGTI